MDTLYAPPPGEGFVLPSDDQPKSGVWIDSCDVLANPTQDELWLGQQLGETIDPDDDEDIGVSPQSFLRATSSDLISAMDKAKILKSVMLEFGVPEVSIELMAGRPNSYGVYDATYIVTSMNHHTVSRFGSNLTPVLSLCKYGRSDLSGPLCNGYGGYDLTYRILTFGYANHPGAGGPLKVPAYSGGTFIIPRDSARRYAWGTEWEGGLNEGDWDRTLRNPRNGKTMTMREFMGRSNAALRKYHKIIHVCEHSTWTSRKIDRLGYTPAKAEAEVQKYINEGEWNMDKDEFQNWVRRTPITTGVGPEDAPKDRPLEKVLADLEGTQERQMKLLREINSKLDTLKPPAES